MKKYLGAFLILWIFFLPQICLAQGGGTALRFNESNDYVNFSAINFGFENTLSITAWVRVDGLSGEDPDNIVSINSSESRNDGQFWLQYNPNDSTFEFAVKCVSLLGSHWVLVKSNTQPDSSKWCHIAGVFSSNELSSNVRIYINGEEENQMSTISGYIERYNSDFLFKFGKNVISSFNGVIDEVTVWTKMLAEEEIRNLVCRKLNGEEKGLAGYWRCDDGDAIIISDYTSNGNNGILSGIDWVNSGALLGDASVYKYPASWFNTTINLAHADGDNITISSVSGFPLGIHVYRVDEKPNVIEPPTGWSKVDPLRYWGVFVVGGLNTLYNLCYNYDGHPGIFEKFENELGLAERENGEATSWNNVNATVNPDANTLTLMEQSGTEYILMDNYGNNPLPITVTSFNAVALRGMVNLRWIVESELNNTWFSILRCLTNDGKYDEIARIPGRGAHASSHEYSYNDQNVSNGRTYWYKLVEVSQSQTNEWGPVKVQYIEQGLCNPIFSQNCPNPFTTSTTIKVNLLNIGHGGEDVVLRIYDLSGRLVRDFSLPISQNSSVAVVSWNGKDNRGNNVANGYYYCVLKTGKGIVRSERMVLIR